MDEMHKCCCCNEHVCVKSLWAEYVWMGRPEVYGDMLRDCFNITWVQTERSNDQNICEICITQLRNAVHFKQKVLECQAQLRMQLLDVMQPVKVEKIEIEINNKTEQEQDLDVAEVNGRDYNAQAGDLCNGDGDSSSDDIPLAVRSKSAAKCLNPKKEIFKKKVTESTARNKRRKLEKTRDNSDVRSSKSINLRQNVGLILEHSTIVPFKSTNGYFNCFYCKKQYASFDQLKSHLIELHENISFKSILKCIRRPRDRIRADVSDINCRLCKKKIDTIDSLIQHLTDAHNVKFNFDSDSVKPADCILGYDLSDGKYRCYQCNAEFFFFKTLSKHMNEHSTEHVCDVCGRCFLLADRLRAHVQTHKESAAKCEYCGKICSSIMLLRSHIRYKHKKLSFMCSICNKTFLTSQKRIKHLEEVHKRKPVNLTCRICSKKFDHQKRLYSHMRSEHLNVNRDPQYACAECGYMFKTKYDLKQHMLMHSGERNYECEICHKKYGRRKTLTQHLRIHMNDRRFACGACSQAFVQKCSLKNHIRVHHSDMDYEQLIVDKKLNPNKTCAEYF